MSAARHAAKPRAKFMLRIMALSPLPALVGSRSGRRGVPFANLRAKVRGIEVLAQGRWAIALGSSSRRNHARHSLRLAPLPWRQSTKLAETLTRLAAS